MTSPPAPELRSFTELIQPLLAPSEVRLVLEMYRFVEDSHRAQVRHEVDAQGKPKAFFSHPLAVARLLIEDLANCNAEDIVIALCHDMLEDTGVPPEELESRAGTYVARAVIQLSQLNDVWKAEYAARLVKYATPRILLVKVCDILHNARTYMACPPDKQVCFVESVRGPYAPLLDLAIELADPRIQARVAAMTEEIRQLVTQPVTHPTETSVHATA